MKITRRNPVEFIENVRLFIRRDTNTVVCNRDFHLFRFLFQSDYFNGKTLLELIDAEELTPVLSAMQRSLGIGMEQTKTVFITVFLFAHGYASIIANNALKYDEDTINSHLERAYRGAILAAQEETA